MAVAINDAANGFMFTLKLMNVLDWMFLFEDDQRAPVACFRDLLERMASTQQELIADVPSPQPII
jgi:hypothetical protein